jgi:hypothetical protein
MEGEPINPYAQEGTYTLDDLRVELARAEHQRDYLLGEIALYEQAGDIPTNVAQTE